MFSWYYVHYVKDKTYVSCSGCYLRCFICEIIIIDSIVASSSCAVVAVSIVALGSGIVAVSGIVVAICGVVTVACSCSGVSASVLEVGWAM